MTQNSDERSSLAAFRVFFAVVGTIIVSSATLPLVQKFNDISGGSNGYFWTALIYAALMVPLYVIVFKKTNEVVKPSPRKKIPIKRTILVIAGNKPLLLIMISTLLASTCLFIRQSMLIYYFAYVVNNADMTALFLTLMALMMIVGIVLAAPISKKLGDKRATMLIGILVSGTTCIGMYFTGPENISFSICLDHNRLYFYGNDLCHDLEYGCRHNRIRRVENGPAGGRRHIFNSQLYTKNLLRHWQDGEAH